jgi:5-methylcytosine-specific restriction protein A
MCSELVEGNERLCSIHKQVESDKIKTYNKRRGNASQRGYDDHWRKYRIMFLMEHPLCTECEKEGGTEAATVVDHIIPHKGDMVLFWDIKNHQTLCIRHHNKKTATLDGGFGNL